MGIKQLILFGAFVSMLSCNQEQNSRLLETAKLNYHHGEYDLAISIIHQISREDKDYEEAQEFLKKIRAERIKLEREQLLINRASDLELLSDWKSQGIIGKWIFNEPGKGFNALVTLIRNARNTEVKILWRSSNEESSKPLIPVDSTSFRSADFPEEKWVIDREYNLEILDEEGPFTKGVSVLKVTLPTTEKVESIKKIEGLPLIRFMKMYTQTMPQLLEGENEEFWELYFPDIHLKIKVNGKNIITQAKLEG